MDENEDDMDTLGHVTAIVCGTLPADHPATRLMPSLVAIAADAMRPRQATDTSSVCAGCGRLSLNGQAPFHSPVCPVAELQRELRKLRERLR